MILTNELLDKLVEQAKESPRLRMNYDLRTQTLCPDIDHEDSSQRMLNAIEPGSIVPIHRHTQSTETVTVLRGAVKQTLYRIIDDTLAEGVTTMQRLAVAEQFVIEAGSPCPMYVVPAGVWHTTESLVSGTIIFEAKDGRYGEDGSESI